MGILRITAVSYLNTFPFVYGIRESGYLKDYRLDLAVPSVCSERLRRGKADIALVPAGALPDLGEVSHVSDYCIGAVKEVKTVLLLSQQPLERISRVGLDFDSRTSVELVKILAKRHWNIAPDYFGLTPGELQQDVIPEAVVAIGDKTFGLRDRYAYCYDLASEWIAFTGKPFVFAVWVSKGTLQPEALLDFSAALGFGVDHISDCLAYFHDRLPACTDCKGYLENNISFHLDAEKREGLDLFLRHLREGL